MHDNVGVLEEEGGEERRGEERRGEERRGEERRGEAVPAVDQLMKAMSDRGDMP
jgi:hypothetical protein